MSAEDAKYQINSRGALAERNAYGEVVAEYDDGSLLPVICGHGGSMWLCRGCADRITDQRDAAPSLQSKEGK